MLTNSLAPAGSQQPQPVSATHSAIGSSASKLGDVADVFLDRHNNEMRRRTLNDCNSVRKLFVLAAAAGIRTREDALLLVSIRGSPQQAVLKIV
jgi:hypothetical protein